MVMGIVMMMGMGMVMVIISANHTEAKQFKAVRILWNLLCHTQQCQDDDTLDAIHGRWGMNGD